MKTWPILLILLCCAAPAFAFNGEKATVHAMHMVPCPDSTGASWVGGAYPGMMGGAYPGMLSVTGGSDKCVEYELRTAKVSYVIQPRRSVLLLVGGDVEIKLAGSKLLLRTTESVKDIRCDVRSMSLLSDVERKEKEKDNHALPLCIDELGRMVECPLETER